MLFLTESYDSEKQRIEYDLEIPGQSFVKIDYYASEDPHPILRLKKKVFQIIPEDEKVVLQRVNVFNIYGKEKWIGRILIFVFLLIIICVGVVWKIFK
jgi:hypothetical protein